MSETVLRCHFDAALSETAKWKKEYADAVARHNRTLDELRVATDALARIYPYVKGKTVRHRKSINGHIVSMNIGAVIDEAFDFIEKRDEREYLK